MCVIYQNGDAFSILCLILGSQKCFGCAVSCFAIPKHHFRAERRDRKIKRKGKFNR